jgi:hypothetical protein
MDVPRVARVGVDEHELADVVEEGRDKKFVALLEANLTGDPLRGALRGDGVEPEALRQRIPDRGALEEVKRGGARGESLDAARGKHLDSLGDRRDLAALRGASAVRDPEDRDHERDVRLDDLDDVRDRVTVLADRGQQAVTRLGERRERLERLERGGEPAAVTLVVATTARRSDAPIRALRGSLGGSLRLGLGGGGGGCHLLPLSARLDKWLSPNLDLALLSRFFGQIQCSIDPDQRFLAAEDG